MRFPAVIAYSLTLNIQATLDGWHRAYSTAAMEYKQFVVQAFQRERGSGEHGSNPPTASFEAKIAEFVAAVVVRTPERAPCRWQLRP